MANDKYFDSYNILCILVYKTNMKELAKTLNTNEEIKKEIYKTTILIHEFLCNFDYLNTSREQEKNFFQIKDNFELRISLPNYQCPALFVKDIILYRMQYAKNKYTDFHKYINTEITIEEFTKILKDIQMGEKKRYCDIIQKSDLPELYQFVIDNIDDHRIGHTISHPSKFLFIKMYEIILKKFFNREIPDTVFENNNIHEPLISSGYSTKLTFYDKVCLQFNSNEEYLNEEDSNNYILKCLENASV